MLVVSDTTPVNYLFHIGEEHLLRELFDEVVIPKEVGAELVRPGGPLETIGGLGTLKDIRVEMKEMRSPTDESALKRLDDGEREAILLAEELGAGLVLMDEKAGRNVAKHRGLQPKGTLGILDAAGKEGLVDVPEAVEKLQETNFHASPNLYEWLLDRHR